MKAGSNLEKILEKGLFAVTAELGPPKGNDVTVIERKASLLKGYADAINVTDNQTAIVRMSSIAACSLLVRMGLEPVMQMVTRDRNRIAMQSDIFGASALGIKNMLCLTGDHQSFGNQIDSKNVHDLDSVQLIDCVRTLRDEKNILGGTDQVEGDIKMFIGAAANPFGDPFEFRVIRLAKKVGAGVALHSDAVHLRHGTLQGMDEDGPGSRASRKGLHSRRGHSLEISWYGPIYEQKRVRDHDPG
jgi:methylenetetrahydrofolate reductase (NADPH)